jgi:2-polyprenyl-3-methyl-5-hydroxy-6-metoxy-1,4-benzoquinol methylase
MENKKKEFNKFILENTNEIRQFSSYMESRGIKGNSLENNAFRRHDRFLKEFLPKITENIPDCEKRTVIEFGFGQGSTSHALSHVFKKVYSFEIDQVKIDIAEKRKQIFNLHNVNFYTYPPELVLKEAIELADDGTVFVLFAVLEHMKEKERLTTLREIWKKMGEDNYLFVGNTPNRLAYYDLHTHEHSFLFTLPDITCLEYLKLDKNIRYAREYIKQFEEEGMEAFSLKRARRGMGISFHDFQIALGKNLNDYVICGDFSKPWKFYDALLAAYFINYEIEVPICFAMRDMYFLLKKNQSREDILQTQRYNESLRIEFGKIVEQAFTKYPEKVVKY